MLYSAAVAAFEKGRLLVELGRSSATGTLFHMEGRLKVFESCQVLISEIVLDGLRHPNFLGLNA